jgi:hypothetical protein
VGCDGYNSSYGLMQTGCDFNVLGTNTSYRCWHEFYPDISYTFSIPVAAGNRVRFRYAQRLNPILLTFVWFSLGTMDTPLTPCPSSIQYVEFFLGFVGAAYIENLDTGKSDSSYFDLGGWGAGENCEWIYEDYEQCGTGGCTQVPMSDFDQVNFTDAKAYDTDGNCYGPNGSQIVDLVDKNNNSLTSTTTGDSWTAIQYIGGSAGNGSSSQVSTLTGLCDHVLKFLLTWIRPFMNINEL